LDSLWHPFWADAPITPTAFGLTLLFAHGWLPSTINAVVPGGWSIAAEMVFYVLFPGLARTVSSLPRAILFAAAAYLLSFGATPLADHLFPIAGSAANRFFAYTWLPNQLVAFSFGFLAYHLIPLLPSWRSLGGVLIGLALACLVATATWPLPFTASWDHPFSRDLIASASSLGLILGLAIWPSKALVNRFIAHVGRISFSVYIWHWVPLELARLIIGPKALPGFAGIGWYGVIFATVTALTLLVAGASFRTIEQPMIEFGNRLAERGQRRASA
jgi:peptidoglycan/LPS O-acetylase OafA/YrhL